MRTHLRLLLVLLSTIFSNVVHAARLEARTVPQPPKGVKTIRTPSGATIRFKQPGKEGICETTKGVGSYSGYIDIGNDTHVFFWFFESRNDPANDPVTLWLNGGPGSDSLIGLFEEIGPCEVDATLNTKLRNVTWSDASNLLFLSQPVGTGFSYSQEQTGILDPTYLTVSPGDPANKDTGRWSVIDPTKTDTTTLAAATAWELLQGFYSGLPSLSSRVKSTKFSLWAESYGGHWGPAFASYFNEQNQKIDQQKKTGRKLDFVSFGLVNAVVDESIQTKYLLEYTQKNTYGLQLINNTIYEHGKFNMYRDGGCQSAQDYCTYLTQDSLMRRSACAAAQYICQNSVEDLYYTYGGNRGVYDIRKCNGDDVPPPYWRDFLNTARVQGAIGTDLNYTSSNLIYTAFSLSGDFGASYLYGIEDMLKAGVQVSLVYGDADYICNWLGGEALSKAVAWSGQAGFQKAGYTRLSVAGKDYGETRQYGKLSFTRVWGAGHEVPYFQPQAAFALFNRSLHGLDVATGRVKITADSSYSTLGSSSATYSQKAAPLDCSHAPSAKR